MDKYDNCDKESIPTEYKCPRCDRLYKYKKTLVKHLVNMHGDYSMRKHIKVPCAAGRGNISIEKYGLSGLGGLMQFYRCNVCGNGYSCKTDLIDHIYRLHTSVHMVESTKDKDKNTKNSVKRSRYISVSRGPTKSAKSESESDSDSDYSERGVSSDLD